MLGVKVSYLISDRAKNEQSLNLISYNALAKRINKASSQEKQLRRACIGSEALILWDSLEQKWRDELSVKFGAPNMDIKKSYFEQNYVTDKTAHEFYHAYTFGDDKRKLPFDVIDEYTFNASVLNTVKIIKDNRKALRKALGGSTMDIWETLSNEVANFRAVPHTVPASSLRRKFAQYAKEGYPALISGRWENQTSRKVDEATLRLLNGLFANQTHKPTPTEVARSYEAFLNGYAEVFNEETGELYNPKGYKKLSLATITNYINKWESKIGTYTVRGGDRQKLMAQFKTYHSLDAPKLAGSIISIDDRQPPFEYEKGKRMWFYNGIDLGSECFTTFVYGKTKEGIIMDFYRQMVRNYAEWGFSLPNELEAEMSLNSQFLNTFLKEGYMFQDVRIEANNARGKRIEQYFRPLRYQVEKKSEGWLARPFSLSEANQKGGQQVPLIPYPQLVESRLLDIETWNNMPHSKEPELTRWEYFCQRQNPNLKPTNYRAIMPYLGYKTDTSCNVGIIKLQRGEFLLGENGHICTGSDLISKMKRAEGKQLQVYWLDGNDGNILKAHIYIGDEYIGEAISKPRYNRAKIEQTQEDLQNRDLMSQYVATIEGYMRKQKGAIEPVAIIDKTPVTLNTGFRISGIKRYEAVEEMAEVIEEETNENEYNYAPATTTATGWRSRFGA